MGVFQELVVGRSKKVRKVRTSSLPLAPATWVLVSPRSMALVPAMAMVWPVPSITPADVVPFHSGAML